MEHGRHGGDVSLAEHLRHGTLCTLRVLMPVALWHVLREEAAGAQLEDAPCQRSDAGGERSLAIAVSAVRPATAQLVGLDVHHGVHNFLGESVKQLLLSMAPSSIRVVASMTGVGSDKISIAVFVLY